MKALTDYKIILRPNDNGTFVAYVPAIKGCHAWGENPEQARSRVWGKFALRMLSRKRDRAKLCVVSCVTLLLGKKWLGILPL